jgi:hypothetical protein
VGNDDHFAVGVDGEVNIRSQGGHLLPFFIAAKEANAQCKSASQYPSYLQEIPPGSFKQLRADIFPGFLIKR